MSFFRLLFWFWLPDPEIGDKYVWFEDSNDPWNENYYIIIDRKGKWYRLKLPYGSERSIKKASLVAFYKKVT